MTETSMPDHVRSYSEKLARIRPDIKVQAMPDQVAKKVPQVKTHEFFVADGQIYIVDPKDNKVADVIKLTPE